MTDTNDGSDLAGEGEAEPGSDVGPLPAVGADRRRRAEQRWPMAAAVVCVAVLHELVPADFRTLPRFVYPIFLFCFLAVLIVGDPGRIDRDPAGYGSRRSS